MSRFSVKMKCWLTLTLLVISWTLAKMASSASVPDSQTAQRSNNTSSDESQNVPEYRNIATSTIDFKAKMKVYRYFRDKITNDTLMTYTLFEKMITDERVKLFLSDLPRQLPFNLLLLQWLFSEKQKRCFNDIYSVFVAANRREKWALEMIDATAKPGSGLLRGNGILVGDFDQCMDLDTGQTFGTRFCRSYIVMQKVLNIPFPRPSGLIMSMCIPESCGPKEIEMLINTYSFIRPDFVGGSVGTECNDSGLEYSPEAVVVLCVFSIIGIIIAVATVYEVYLKIRKILKESEESESNSTSFPGSMNASERKPIVGMEKGKLYSDNNSTVAERKSKGPYFFHQALMSFSLYTNVAKFVSTDRPKGTITCMDGIRVISMTIIAYYHLLVHCEMHSENWRTYHNSLYDSWINTGLFNAALLVDSFFAMSGMLLTYLTLKGLANKPLTPGFFSSFYLQRYFRLTPVFLVIIAVQATLTPYLSDGPMWPKKGLDHKSCVDHWWANIIYINNLLKGQCMEWAWYLSADMQFYVISPILFLPMFYYGWRGLIAPSVVLLASVICVGVMTYVNDLPAVPTLDAWLSYDKLSYTHEFFNKPYIRIGPYIIGMMTGFLLYKSQNEATMSKKVVAIGWVAAIGTAIAIAYGPYGHVQDDNLYSAGVAALYNAPHRSLWAVCVCWIIFACHHGYGGFINTLLSWKAFVPFSKLSYCVYLIHPIIQIVSLNRLRRPIYMDSVTVLYMEIAIIVTSYAVAFIFYIGFEVPSMRLANLVKARLKSTSQ